MVILAGFILSPCGCRFGAAGDKENDQTPKNPVAVQQPIGNGPGVSAGEKAGDDGVLLGEAQVDDAGALQARLIISLEYFPPSRPNIAALPRCAETLASDLLLGKLVCIDRGGEVDIFAAQVVQECAAGTDKRRIEPQRLLRIENCRHVKIFAFPVNREVRLRVDSPKS